MKMNRKGSLIHFLPFVVLAALAPGSVAAAASAPASEVPGDPAGPPPTLVSDDLGELHVVVREGQFGPTVSAAFLRLEGPDQRTGVTDAAGVYRFERLPAGTYTLQAEHLGYGAVEVEVEVAGDDRTTRILVEMHREPIALEGIEVEVEGRRPTWGPLERVYERVEWQQRLGLGSFITREEIENRVAMRIEDLIRGRMAGVRVGPRGGISMTRSATYRSSDVSCRVQIYLDGVNVTGRGGFEGISPNEVELIEVYRGLSQTPAEFGGYEARCGVVAVWTRRGF
jgi:hypothetical protein